MPEEIAYAKYMFSVQIKVSFTFGLIAFDASVKVPRKLASPIIVIIIIIYICCCKNEKKAKLPPKSKATAESLSKCADCPICFQSFNIGDDIIILPCSPMHIFHDNCITAWTKVKPNCPVCRY